MPLRRCIEEALRGLLRVLRLGDAVDGGVGDEQGSGGREDDLSGVKTIGGGESDDDLFEVNAIADGESDDDRCEVNVKLVYCVVC